MPRSFSPLPWKKTFRKLPPNVEATLDQHPNHTRFVACCEKTVSERELTKGIFRHLNIDSIEDVTPEFTPLIPSPNVGLTSFRNATPIEEEVRSAGKMWKTIHGRAPTRGRFRTHPTQRKIEVWFRRLAPPAMSYIAFKKISDRVEKGALVFFQVTEVLDAADKKGILRCLNLLQENVGLAELRPVETAEAEAIRHLNESVGWEILPDDANHKALARVIGRLGGRKSEGARRVQDRLGIIRSLKPTRTLLSTRGLVGYLVVEFGRSLTIFENLEIDHAMFIAHGPAEEFIRLNRSELTAKLGGQIERLIHSKGWEERLRSRVKLERGDQSPNADEMI